MSNKKANLPIMKVILILFTTSMIFISFMFFFFDAKNINIDNKKINTQIAIKKIINSNCFSDNYATIEESKFTQKKLNDCFKNFDEEIYLNLAVINIHSKQISMYKNYLYLNENKKEFKTKSIACNSFSSKSNYFCSTIKMPITYLNANNLEFEAILEINIIV